MFELMYCCDNLKKREIHLSEQKFEDSFNKEFGEKINVLDKFIFLVDMYRIVDSCADDLMSVEIGNDDDFWKINKRLLNYVNAVYSYKEYANGYNESVKSITKKYYNEMGYYRFICDFRNYIIHQSIIIKDYKPADKDIFVNIEKIANQLNEYPYEKEWQRKNANEFIDRLKAYKEVAFVYKGEYFLSMKKITTAVKKEMTLMKEDVLPYVFKESIKPSLKWILELIPRIDGKYQYTFILDKVITDGSLDNSTLIDLRIDDLIMEPNCVLEDFTRRMLKTLGKNTVICKELLSWLNEEKYIYFYEGACDIENYIRDVIKKE